MYILGSSLAKGKKAGLLSVLGISTGCLVHTGMAALGLSIILSRSAVAFNLVKYVGAAYLVYLGVLSIRSKSSFLIQKDRDTKNDNTRLFGQAVMTNVLNPKVAMFFLAFLPQFIDPLNSYGALPFLLLGITFITTGTLWGMVLALGTSCFAARLSSPHAAAWLNKAAGIIYMGLGLNLLRAKISG
jgi:threonine/homoserine/homoserine lactone efflux protein